MANKKRNQWAGIDLPEELTTARSTYVPATEWSATDEIIADPPPIGSPIITDYGNTMTDQYIAAGRPVAPITVTRPVQSPMSRNTFDPDDPEDMVAQILHRNTILNVRRWDGRSLSSIAEELLIIHKRQPELRMEVRAQGGGQNISAYYTEEESPTELRARKDRLIERREQDLERERYEYARLSKKFNKGGRGVL